MGLLDDAIRQHLDLKRLHGADPSDVAKLEREAFGPPEHAEPASPAAAPEADPVSAADHEAAQEEEAAYEEAELEAEEEWAEAHPEPVADAPLPALEEEDVVIEHAAEPDATRGSVRLDPDAPAEPDAPAAPREAAAPEGGHDELEETPEFLQETPEHDRLWFEQKPPRDFDF